ncbi:MAG: AsnC family transcriptional regulator [Thermoplasmata archaeon]|nr:AsnC family transcriptional regulator [Thermoplasmata archaeon]
MSSELDPKDPELLRALQEDFPVTERPFEEIAERMGWTEEEVISRIRILTDSGVIRKLGAVLNPRKMGYVSVLAALDVPEESLDGTASVINEYSSVTHNYQREGRPNLWFTMTEPDQATLEKHLAEIEENIGLSAIKMPVTKMFKIGVKLDI